MPTDTAGASAHPNRDEKIDNPLIVRPFQTLYPVQIHVESWSIFFTHRDDDRPREHQQWETIRAIVAAKNLIASGTNTLAFAT